MIVSPGAGLSAATSDSALVSSAEILFCGSVISRFSDSKVALSGFRFSPAAITVVDRSAVKSANTVICFVLIFDHALW